MKKSYSWTLTVMGSGSTVFVMSPHSTLRWRRGELLLVSGVAPHSVIVEQPSVPILSTLVHPTTLDNLYAEFPYIEPQVVEGFIQDLERAGIVERFDEPENPTDCWWDNDDRSQYEISVIQIMKVAHGLARSADEAAPLDRWGHPVPWIARPVIDFLFQLDLSQLSVFEYGGGASTLFWSKHCKRVTCAETDRKWYEQITASRPKNCHVIYEPDSEKYPLTISQYEDRYDIILIDCLPEYRNACAGESVSKLSNRGMIILDDAPFYHEAAARLRGEGLIEVDITGYCPLEYGLQTTSLFLSKSYDLPRRHALSPAFPFGSPYYRWEQQSSTD